MEEEMWDLFFGCFLGVIKMFFLELLFKLFLEFIRPEIQKHFFKSTLNPYKVL